MSEPPKAEPGNERLWHSLPAWTSVLLGGIGGAAITAFVSLWQGMDTARWDALLEQAESRIEREVAKTQQSYHNAIVDSLTKAVQAAANAESTQARVSKLTDQLQTQLKDAKSLENDIKQSSERFATAVQGNYGVTAESVANVLMPLLSNALHLRGAVVPFALPECPEGWVEYEPAFGRFIRGVDRSDEAKTDPDGLRKTGSIQEDAFQGHAHSTDHAGGIPGLHGTGGGSGASARAAKSAFADMAVFRVTGPTALTKGDTVRVGVETRPKNVALLFCIRKETKQ